MVSLRGYLKNNTFIAEDNVDIPNNANVIVTFLDESISKALSNYSQTQTPPKITRETFLGCMKGKMSEAEDHDWFEPLEDFEEYM